MLETIKTGSFNFIDFEYTYTVWNHIRHLTWNDVSTMTWDELKSLRREVTGS